MTENLSPEIKYEIVKRRSYADAGFDSTEIAGIESSMRTYLHEKWPEFSDSIENTIKVGEQIICYLEEIFEDQQQGTSELKSKILEKLLDQQITNPEQYVSHGADHALEVSEIAQKAHDALPSLQQALQRRFGPQAEKMVQLTALLHDIGYPDMKPEDPKMAHVEYGARMFREELAPLLETTLGLTKAQLAEMEYVISNHDNDGIENREVKVLATDQDSPLLFAVRMADRMDMSADRLSEIQRNPQFRAILRELYVEGQQGGRLYAAKGAEEYKKILHELRQELVQKHSQNLAEETKKRLDAIVKYCNDQSYPHFVGCLAVETVDFEESTDGSMIITVKKIPNFSEDLKIGDIPITNYQVWRAELAIGATLMYQNKMPSIILE